MEIDLADAGAEFLQDSSKLRAEVCVVGGGIAGLVLAHRLAADGVDVVLLEAGGRQLSVAAEVEPSGEAHAGSREGRPEALGGSSLVWGGQLLPMLDGADWPVATREIERFYGDVHKLVKVDDLPYQGQAFLQALGQPWPSALEQLPRLAARMSKFASFGTRNLGISLGGQLRRSLRARVLLHARVTALHMDAGERVRSVEVRTPDGKLLRIEAGVVVLAAGTVETCRLLLASGRGPGTGVEGGIGNRHGQLGRNFHDHLTVEVARFEGAGRDRAVGLFRPWVVGGLRGTLHGFKLEPHEALRRKLRLNPALAHVTFEEPGGSGVAAVRAMLLARQRGEAPARIDWGGLPGALLDTWRLRREVRGEGRRYISPEVRVGLRVNVAQEVPGSSRVELADRMDAFGQPLARVHWQVALADLRSVRVFAEYLRKRFNAFGFEGLTWNPDALPRQRQLTQRGSGAGEWKEYERPLPGMEDARHAMGGACMGTDSRTSVVDADLKVHGVENLYVASAAVFPDGRPQLPTLTLMALTLRLAEQLGAEHLGVTSGRGR